MKAALLRYAPLLLLALAWEASARSGLVSTLALLRCLGVTCGVRPGDLEERKQPVMSGDGVATEKERLPARGA